MSAHSKAAKKRIVVRRKSSPRSKYTPPKLPESPPVTKGPRSYGLSKGGRHIVIRFYITQMMRMRLYKNRWWVMDMLEGHIAKGTEKEGYRSKKEAANVARRYRDKYGEWARTPF